MNVFFHEFKLGLRSIPSYVIVAGVFLLIFLGFYPSFAQDSKQMVKMLENFPKEVLVAMGISIDTLTSFNGYLSYIYLYIAIILAIAGMNLGLLAFSRENIDKTSDFLLTKPISRTKLGIIKIFSSAILVFLVNLLVSGLIFLLTKFMISNEIMVKPILFVCTAGFLISTMFMGNGFVLSNIFRIKNTTMATAGVVTLLYLLTMLANITNDEKFSWITPFKYFDFPLVMQNSSLKPERVLVSIGVILIFCLVSALIYKRRDIRQV